MITADEARSILGDIRRMAHDDERAHSREDYLRARVLAAIAQGAPNAAELAHIALATSDIRFERWCA